MEQLVNQVAQRTGIPADKARTAVDTVVGYLKEHLPGPIASQLDGAVSGQAGGQGAGQAQGGGLAGAAKGLGGMLGGRKESG